MTQKELARVIKNHQHWLNKDCKGWESMRANLAGADLTGADLSHVNLSHADLSHAKLRWAIFIDATLTGADLSYADLSEAYLVRARLIYTNLTCADLSYTNLSHVNLSHVNLARADLKNAFNIPFIPMACPTEGSFIGWKKANGEAKKVIVKLLIPEDARRSSATGRKCRCDRAKVLSITSLNGEKQYETAYSSYNNDFVYEVGKGVSVPDFCEDRFKECAAGIHFFINREEAVRYYK